MKFEGEDFSGVDLIPKDKFKVVLGDTLEDGSELSVLGCGASRGRRVLGFAMLPATKKINVLKKVGLYYITILKYIITVNEFGRMRKLLTYTCVLFYRGSVTGALALIRVSVRAIWRAVPLLV